ncbi:MAG: DNA polymerase III, subunit gamma and tau [Candidatus Wildermuthbacteria bacterium RIFCSPHIGHO2_12_FULL_45_9]|nr:MAG: DNA polymerase III, subunit gamma and tau [Candidatus Wildermuthbacteria bacterium RIFCSPHIGHO2_01_FULL_45_20]OHA71902.1 MAG: DNA polymerase III, subunit gamma and tau [Candidatus Wildermuthbacteria bacterium RIFCSPHIGHO2_12_FULL_45_9]
MANIVLYRKYRPSSFGEVVGQEHIVKTIKNAVAGNLISHAYLFSGPRGSGKTSLARLLAKAVNCENPKDGEPCNECSACQEISGGRAMDLIEIDAASNRGIEEMRDLKEGIKFAPVKLKYKVFIIDEAHQLSKDAANALLKTLEEPPAHAIFVLATTESHKMIPTIASRCQRFDFRKLTVQQMKGKLEEIAMTEKVNITLDALQLIALNSGGAMRDAISLLDRVITFYAGSRKKIDTDEVKALLGIVDLQIVAEFAQLLGEKKAGGAVEFLNKNLEEGMDPHEFAKNVVEYLRHVMVLKINPQLAEGLEAQYTPEQITKLKEQGNLFAPAELPKIIERFLEAENKMKYASIVQLPLELATIESCLPKE